MEGKEGNEKLNLSHLISIELLDAWFDKVWSQEVLKNWFLPSHEGIFC